MEFTLEDELGGINTYTKYIVKTCLKLQQQRIYVDVVPEFELIDSFGYVVIGFDQSVQYSGNFTMLHEDTIGSGQGRPIIDLKIIPGASSSQDDLAFSWKPLSMDDTHLKIQVSFESPGFVSFSPEKE